MYITWLRDRGRAFQKPDCTLSHAFAPGAVHQLTAVLFIVTLWSMFIAYLDIVDFVRHLQSLIADVFELPVEVILSENVGRYHVSSCSRGSVSRFYKRDLMFYIAC